MHLTRLRLFPVSPTRRHVIAAGVVTAALLAATPSGVAAKAASAPPAANPAVITEWNATAVTTIVVDAGKANVEALIWYSFEQAAVYNAVVGITGRYAPYRWDARGPRGASPEAAAAAAAYRLLLTYFPASQPRLDAAYVASLARIPDGRAERLGVRFGERAAAHMIKLRTGDGRNAPIQFTKPLEPGVWRPTADPPVPFFAPWLSQLRPLLLCSPRQFRPGPPPPLTSAKYAREFNEVKTLGSATSAARTEGQTQTALFFSDIGIVPLQASLRDVVGRHHLDISDSARVLAAVDMSIADAIIATWDTKFHYGFWRPITAIRLADTDGNPATAPDTSWTSLINAPPYPDYTSGLTAIIGAASRALERALGTKHIDLFITSTAAGETRHYEFAGRLNREAIDARVWSGLHFRTADRVGNTLAKEVADWALDHAFQPGHRHTGDRC